MRLVNNLPPAEMAKSLKHFVKQFLLGFRKFTVLRIVRQPDFVVAEWLKMLLPEMGLLWGGALGHQIVNSAQDRPSIH